MLPFFTFLSFYSFIFCFQFFILDLLLFLQFLITLIKEQDFDQNHLLIYYLQIALFNCFQFWDGHFLLISMLVIKKLPLSNSDNCFTFSLHYLSPCFIQLDNFYLKFFRDFNFCLFQKIISDDDFSEPIFNLYWKLWQIQYRNYSYLQLYSHFLYHRLLQNQNCHYHVVRDQTFNRRREDSPNLRIINFYLHCCCYSSICYYYFLL